VNFRKDVSERPPPPKAFKIKAFQGKTKGSAKLGKPYVVGRGGSNSAFFRVC